MPTVFGDELIHWDASRSLAAGDGLRVRDGGYGFAPGYPALLAPVHLLADDDLSAYGWARLLERALLRARRAPGLSALARRLLAPVVEPRLRGAGGRPFPRRSTRAS